MDRVTGNGCYSLGRLLNEPDRHATPDPASRAPHETHPTLRHMGCRSEGRIDPVEFDYRHPP